MMRLPGLTFVVLMLAACAGYPAPSIASNELNIMIMGEDEDPSSISRDSQIFRRVLNSISNELGDAGYNVIDETAVTLDDFKQGRTRRSDAEVIDIAKSVKRPPIDVAVLFSIYPEIRRFNYTTKIQVRVEGRLLQVINGKRLGNFELDLPAAENAPANCDKVCLRSYVGNVAKQLSQDISVILTKKLNAIAFSSGSNDFDNTSGLTSDYTLIFDGFDSGDIDQIEEYVVAFIGYKSHRPNRTSLRYNEYSYKTTAKSARLNRNLKKMLKHLGLEGRVAFGGGTFKVKKITLR